MGFVTNMINQLEKEHVHASNQMATHNLNKGRVKIYRVPGPGPSTGGRRLFFEKK